MSSIDFKMVPVDELRPNPWNTNKASPEVEMKIRESLVRNGMFKPIIARTLPGQPGYEILGGQHRWEQACELGYETVPVTNLGEIDDKKAKEIGVIDNTRYGVDDTLAFADLLKEIGSVEDLQSFLPFGETDLDAIFSASTIALDDLDALDEPEETVVSEEPTPKVEKTHTVVRFKIALADAERLTALLSTTRRQHGYTTADDLTNSGDALIHLLGSQLPQVGAGQGVDLADADAIEALEAAFAGDDE